MGLPGYILLVSYISVTGKKLELNCFFLGKDTHNKNIKRDALFNLLLII